MFAFLARRQTRKPDVDVVPLRVVAENNAPLAQGQPVTEELDTASAEHPPGVADCYGFNRCMRADDKRCPAAAAFVGRMSPMTRGHDRAGRATVPARVGRAAHQALKERSPRPLRRHRPYENGPGRTDALHSNPPLVKRKKCRPARAAVMCDWLPLEPTRWERKSGQKGEHPSGATGERWQRTRHGRHGASTVSRASLRPCRCCQVPTAASLGRNCGTWDPLPALLPAGRLPIDKGLASCANPLIYLVGAEGFEPSTPAV